MSTSKDLILKHPNNVISNPGYKTGSDKPWARTFKPIKKVTSHTIVGRDDQYHSDFETGFMELQNDDRLRFNQQAVPPNNRHWRLETEADCENWFNTEVVNVVLSAWHSYPSLTQSSHIKPISENSIPENIDSVFSIKVGQQRKTVAIGEIKRNLLIQDEWQNGTIASPDQRKLSQELRGYAAKYVCPQVFCFDGAVLVLLQFRAFRAEDISDEKCPIDCWTLPIDGSSCSLRYGLYRLLAQGWRRCQAELAAPFSIGGLQPYCREYFNGQPIWKVNGQKQRSHPNGYQRGVDQQTGALIWSHQVYPVEWETGPFWE
ncbi:hypothetical protein FOQG_19012 [Fusarium oxysporum f. sp. raphani 54005]|uniref:Uncharacterized protein n=1 Tax=Fusarium oxysporum f. sp. raphani 54005 TaxID=1089458 RepID=X0C0C2_FUSOX|nr:hypothetical protein FOQG_19012 [Fusarium oxysporum f. sp. raphani 54005]